VIGDIGGNPMNIAVVIGAFAALSKKAGIPLRFPGSMRTYREVLGQLTDAQWLGRASVWAALSDNARNEAFNLVGEPFRWERIWKRVGAALDIEVGEPQPMSLATHMPAQAAQWQRLAEQNDLKMIPYSKLVNWFFGDVVFNIPMGHGFRHGENPSRRIHRSGQHGGRAGERHPEFKAEGYSSINVTAAAVCCGGLNPIPAYVAMILRISIETATRSLTGSPSGARA
jgi:hypothetical protein